MVLLNAEGGLSPMEVIQAATRNAARAIQLGDRIGTVEPGKDADITVVRGDPLARLSDMRRVVLVLKGGKPVSLK